MVGRTSVLIKRLKLCSATQTGFKRTFLWKFPAPEEWFRWRLGLNINVVQCLVPSLIYFQSNLSVSRREDLAPTWNVLEACVTMKARYRLVRQYSFSLWVVNKHREFPVLAWNDWWRHNYSKGQTYSCPLIIRLMMVLLLLLFWAEGQTPDLLWLWINSGGCHHLYVFHGRPLCTRPVLKGLEKLPHVIFKIILRRIFLVSFQFKNLGKYVKNAFMGFIDKV